MIGFDTFLILNDESTDDTQCILDAYAKENIVLRIPFDVGDSYSGKLWHIFDDCANYLNSHPEQFNPSKTWMMTHDTDEFVYIKRRHSIHNAVMQLSNPNQAMSLKVPRLTFGSSGQEYYQPGLVIDRFAWRFNHTMCPEVRKKYGKKGLFKGVKGGRGSPCSWKTPPSDSYDNVKSISLVSQMAEKCYALTEDGGQLLLRNACADTHKHTLVDVTEHRGMNETNPVAARGNSGKERENDPRYVNPITVGEEIVLMHYWVKSRQEFYERACSSVWSDKYFECPECTPESFFGLTNTYANSFHDLRMARVSPQLTKRLEDSSIGASCETQAKLQSMDYYRQCFDRIGAELRDGTRNFKHGYKPEKEA
eukprot:CAMPEP_0183767970 /NCGR_PEP_ID=MMETSP0739-20130205/12495_1 /TAXON_ID=385413 /ORGANISM="Thalassiosira miniscula, Strain CCMP1093" /LENGTH=365 /DNA_ID=CAMNT_0026006919 /DNA_START=336 /DNA_END=1433 /DNA_ORIENTATION=-